MAAQQPKQPSPAYLLHSYPAAIGRAAPWPGTEIKDILVKKGVQVDSDDLLVIME